MAKRLPSASRKIGSAAGSANSSSPDFCGTSGAGASSLLAAALGAMRKARKSALFIEYGVCVAAASAEVRGGDVRTEHDAADLARLACVAAVRTCRRREK